MCLNVRSCTALASFVWSNRSPLHCNLENNLGAMQPYFPFYCDLFLWVLKLVFLNNRVSAWKGVCWHESARQKENIKFRYKHSLWLQWRRQRVQYNKNICANFSVFLIWTGLYTNCGCRQHTWFGGCFMFTRARTLPLFKIYKDICWKQNVKSP